MRVQPGQRSGSGPDVLVSIHEERASRGTGQRGRDRPGRISVVPLRGQNGILSVILVIEDCPAGAPGLTEHFVEIPVGTAAVGGASPEEGGFRAIEILLEYDIYNAGNGI